MKKSRVKTWLFVLFVWLLFMGFLSFGVLVFVRVNDQITLEDEIYNLESTMNEKYPDEAFLEERFQTIVTDGAYANVEKSLKNYLKEYYKTYQEIKALYEDDTIAGLLSYQNMVVDGPIFTASLSYAEKFKTKLSTLSLKEEKLYDADYYMSFYSSSDGVYYKDYYEEQIKDYLGTSESIKEELDDTLNVVQIEIDILNHLKKNQGSWYLENGGLYFSNGEVEKEYYILLNKFNEREESVDL